MDGLTSRGAGTGTRGIIDAGVIAVVELPLGTPGSLGVAVVAVTFFTPSEAPLASAAKAVDAVVRWL